MRREEREANELNNRAGGSSSPSLLRKKEKLAMELISLQLWLFPGRGRFSSVVFFFSFSFATGLSFI